MSEKEMRKSPQCQIPNPIVMILMLLRRSELTGVAVVVGSWLLDLTADVLRNDPHSLNDSLEAYLTAVRVAGRLLPLWIWGFPLLSSQLPLYERFNSRGLGAFASKVLNGMRFMFGDHYVR
jgi:6-phosphogluconate dehydrogenase